MCRRKLYADNFAMRIVLVSGRQFAVAQDPDGAPQRQILSSGLTAADASMISEWVRTFTSDKRTAVSSM